MEMMPPAALKKAFTNGLLKWNREDNTREMPWKGEKDPYRIWISEIILQQTRVEQGWAYYNRFIKLFPDIQKLAKAPDEKVFKCWEGLGYYSRCRNLIATARYIAKENKGVFPDTYDEILELKGIGPYTAAAIASFAFQLPHAVVDGNVFRVLSRYFGIATATDSTTGKKLFTELAEDLLDKKQPGIYNQAIMDFGAVICKPAAPLCENCVLKKKCVALTTARVQELPVKAKKSRIRDRWFIYFILEHKGYIAVRQRKAKDIWQDLYEFPMVELKKAPGRKMGLQDPALQTWLGKVNVTELETPVTYRQLLSHQQVHGYFSVLQTDSRPPGDESWEWVRWEQLKKLSFPGLINQYLVKNNIR